MYEQYIFVYYICISMISVYITLYVCISTMSHITTTKCMSHLYSINVFHYIVPYV